ncbi:MAG: NFACT RNA binding domain-containing protein [bacterium]|nr:NFACT RNA binding domain-containing protein [bacterium]
MTDLFPAKVLAAKILNNDRIFGIWLKNREREFAIIFELIGSLANLFVINEDGKVIYIGRRVKDKRSLRPGVIYTLPEKNQTKAPQWITEDLKLFEIRSGFVCKLPDGLVFEIKKPVSDAYCIEYFPYTYALDVYFNEIYGREFKSDFSPTQLDEIISYLESNFSPEDIVDDDFILFDGIKVPVKRGTKVSKLIGHLRARLISYTKSDEKKMFKSFELKGIKEFKSPSGKKVLVGRSAQSNHKITFNLAKRDDLVFHVSGYKGAHVLLVSDGTEVTEDDIRFCATLALKFSDAGSGKWEVRYAPAKFVFRSKNMPAGAFVFKKYKSVVVEK